MAVGREVDFGGAISVEEGSCALHLGEPGFLDTPVLQPGMENASAEGGMKFPEQFYWKFLAECYWRGERGEKVFLISEQPGIPHDRTLEGRP